MYEFDIGGKDKRYMKKKIKYTNIKIGKVEVVKDFIPKPEKLVFKETNNEYDEIRQTKLFLESISRRLSDSEKGETFSTSQLKGGIHKKSPGKGK
jgi:hypothetical protein